MDHQTVLYSVENEIATITLNRPQALNAMNEELIDALSECLNQVKLAHDVRIVILTGSGRAFCAGGDLSYLSALKDLIATNAFITKVGNLTKQIRQLDQPVIAMVNGVAAGAGFNLALATDLIYCAESARFAQSFAKVGLVPDCAGMYLLPRIVGLHKAKELMFTADLIDAKTAAKLGIVNKIIADDALTAQTHVLAEKLKQSAPLALSLIKRTLNQTETATFSSLLTQEAVLQTICMQTNDHKEGLAAFKEKRPPVFTGK